MNRKEQFLNLMQKQKQICEKCYLWDNDGYYCWADASTNICEFFNRIDALYTSEAKEQGKEMMICPKPCENEYENQDMIQTQESKTKSVTVWIPVKDGDDRARGIFNRHYSRHHYKDGRKPRLFVGPGEKLVLLNSDCTALFIWRKFIEQGETKPKGINCAVFRNEGFELSSNLIHSACAIAWQRWPGERLYTFVNPKKIRSSNPGYCFIKAGWVKCGFTKSGLVILDRHCSSDG